MARSLNQAINSADNVFCYAQSSGVHFEVSKELAKTIWKAATTSQNFRFVDSGSVITLYI